MSVKVYKKHPSENRYFAGVVFCGVCGEKMQIHGQYKKDEKGEDVSHASYFCPNRKKDKCSAISVRQLKIEQAFTEYINNIKDFNTLDEIQLAMKKEIKEQNIELIKNYQKQYEKLERQEKELVNTYVQGNIDIDNYKLLKSGIDKEKKNLSITIERIESYVDEEITIKKENIIRTLKENWETLNNEEKRQFIINFISRIEIVNEKTEGKRSGVTKILNIEFNQN